MQNIRCIPDPRRWILTIYKSEKRDQILTVHRFSTIRAIAAVIQENPSHISNCYHGLVKPRGRMRYCTVARRQSVRRLSPKMKN